MTAQITYPTDGRGAWNSYGIGGTLNAAGTAAGRFYRAAASGASVDPVGRIAYRADRDWEQCSIDDYAVWRGAIAVQVELKDLGYYGGGIDGIWGSITDAAVRTFQSNAGLTADGIYGPMSARTMWRARCLEVVKHVGTEHPDLGTILVGTCAWESGWDPGAVGTDTNDLGLCQINGLAHPTMSINDRLNPKLALPYAARLILSNLKAMNFVTRDAIAAYNLGVTGARNWIAAGRPDIWKDRNVKNYIDRILALGATG